LKLFDFGHNNLQLNLTDAKVISVVSGKGGVGKTVLAYNIAVDLSKNGYRVLLIDGDFFFGNLHILSNVYPKDGLDRFISGEAVLDRSVTKINSNLDLLASIGENLFDPNDIKNSQTIIKNIIRQCSRYDFVIVDHSSGVSTFTEQFVTVSNINLLVLVPELTSLSDGFGFVKYIYKKNRESNCSFLINRCSSAEESDYIHKKFCALSESYLDVTPIYIGTISDSDNFRKSVSLQQSIHEIDRNSVVIQQLRDVSSGLIKSHLKSNQNNSVITKMKINNNHIMADIKE